jgi:hypothetical protein
MLTPSLKRPLDRAEIDREAVIAQLERILEYRAFRSSARSAKFLRYIVEYWLEGEHLREPLKERTLGVALFGQDPAYDTTQNTIVRNAAVDVRKRLVLYYLEPGHAGEIQITLPAGSYLPEIQFPEQNDQQAESGLEAHFAGQEEKREIHSDAQSSVPEAIVGQFRRRNPAFLTLILLAAVGIGVLSGMLIARHLTSPSFMDEPDMKSLNMFWHPVLDARPPQSIVLISVGQMAQPVNNQQVTPIGNVFATADIARLLAAEGVKFRIDVANAFTAEELQSSTVILIGGLDNPWSSFATENLRFHIASQDNPGSNPTRWIEDSNNPGKRDWSFSSPSQNSGESVDYAILARVKDPHSGQWRVLVSGLGDVGTSAASKILVLASNMREITKQLPAGWASRNIEIILKIRIMNGKPDYTQMATYEIW